MKKRNMLPVILGNGTEWFNYVVYLSMSVYLGQLFFPDATIKQSTFYVICIFCTSYVARPVGGWVFGIIGDKKGRKVAMVASGSLLCASSLLMTVMPTYESAGMLAPAFLITLRLLQSFALGGESAGMMTWLIESPPANKRNLYSAIETGIENSGLIAAAIVVFIVHGAFQHNEIIAWAWRIPFALSALTALAMLYMRLSISETVVFTRNVKGREDVQKLTGDDIKNMVRVFLLTLGPGTLFYAYSYFLNTYFKQQHLGSATAYFLPVFTALLIYAAIPVTVKLANQYGWLKLTATSFLACAVLVCPIFALIGSGDTVLIYIAVAALVIIIAPPCLLYTRLIVEVSRTGARVRTLGLGMNIGSAVFGATTPIVCTLLLNDLHSSIAPGIYIAATSLLSFFILIKSTAHLKSVTS